MIFGEKPTLDLSRPLPQNSATEVMLFYYEEYLNAVFDGKLTEDLHL